MRVDFDTAIPMDDGVLLRADVYRPTNDDPAPVIISYGPYGKNLDLRRAFASDWDDIRARAPEVEQRSSNRYLSLEVVDPEPWVACGYVIVRVDSRGAGRSPGFLDNFSRREVHDYYTCIEWVADQPWASGKVGLLGMSYYATMQWLVAALHPPHLAAMCVWDGFSDYYRDFTYHGGILTSFLADWFETQITPVQHGLGRRGPFNADLNVAVTGDLDLSDAELAANRAEPPFERALAEPLDSPFYRDRSAAFELITTPFVSIGSWGMVGQHLRGNIEAYTEAAATEKWLVLRRPDTLVDFYSDAGFCLQRRFFDHFLKGQGDWNRQPPVLVSVRDPDGTEVERGEAAWPIPRTEWLKLYLHFDSRLLNPDVPPWSSASTYRVADSEVTVRTRPFEIDTEITGPLACHLVVSSSADDADLFLVVRIFDRQGAEVFFQGAADPRIPLTNGWLRLSHRRLDPDRTKPYRPYHTHDVAESVVPGDAYDVDVELWPTSLVIPRGFTLALTIQGRDFTHGHAAAETSFSTKVARGSQFWEHDVGRDRPPAGFDTVVSILSEPSRPSYLLLPTVPLQTPRA